MMLIGKQHNGTSPLATKQMAWRAISEAVGDASLGNVADVGGGRGELALSLSQICSAVNLLDFSPPIGQVLPANVVPVQADLNATWPLPSAAFDFAFSLEVVEHLENPRHFFREMKRIVRPGGYSFVSTPNNHSISSKITFLLRGQHRLFQEPSYPAHITPLLRCDFERIGGECGLTLCKWFYSNDDTVPRLHWKLPFGGRWFSTSIGVLYKH